MGTTTTTARKTGIYLRISYDRNHTELGVDRQLEDCMRRCERLGGEPVIYRDNDRSASKYRKANVRREAYDQLIADMQSGALDAVIAWDTDRLFRELIEAEKFIDLADEKHIELATVGGDYDLSNPNDRLRLRMEASVAAHYVENMSKKQKRAILQRAEMGRAWWPHRPFGYTMPATGRRPEDYQRPTLVRKEANAIRAAYKAVLAGVSLRSIARGWNAKGLSTPTKDSGGSTRGGKPWTGNAVRAVLMSPRNAGLRAYAPKGSNGKIGPQEIVGQGDWPAIVTEDLWRGVAAKLSDPARSTNGGNTARKYLLSGLALCGKCGAKLGSHIPFQTKRPVYACKKCNGVRRSVADVDRWVIGRVIDLLSDADAVELLVRREHLDVAELVAEAQALEAQQNELANLFAERKIKAAQLATGTANLEKQIAEVRSRMRDADKARVLDGVIGVKDVRAKFDRLGLDRQRAMIGLLYGITIHPGQAPRRPFDKDLVKVARK